MITWQGISFTTIKQHSISFTVMKSVQLTIDQPYDAAEVSVIFSLYGKVFSDRKVQWFMGNLYNWLRITSQSISFTAIKSNLNALHWELHRRLAWRKWLFAVDKMHGQLFNQIIVWLGLCLKFKAIDYETLINKNKWWKYGEISSIIEIIYHFEIYRHQSCAKQLRHIS